MLSLSMDSKNQLLYFMLSPGNLSLSHYDFKFLTNLQCIITENDRITTNQAKLFDKLVDKYNKQLSKTNLDVERLKHIDWKTKVVDSSPTYTNAKVSVNDGNLEITLPFNKTFITVFRSVDNNPFTWEKNQHKYIAPFGTYALKIAYTMLPRFFTTVYSDDLVNVIRQLEDYDKAKYWAPTLVKVNDRLLIAGINETLDDQLKDVELSLEPRTLQLLNDLGIRVDESLCTTPERLFASTHTNVVEVRDMHMLPEYMSQCGITHVYMSKAHHYLKQITHLFDKLNIIVYNNTNMTDGIKLPKGSLVAHIVTSSSPKAYYRNTYTANKIVVLKNSDPVVIFK